MPPPLAEALADEIERVVTAIRQDRVYFMMYWNGMRERSPMVDAVQTRWHEHSAETLLALAPHELRAVTRFHERLQEFRVYVSHTDDMPATLEHRLSQAADRFTTLGTETLTALGRTPPWAELP